jgi:hypothetical protein
MKISQIRELVNARPFKPIIFHLDNGKKQLIKNPQFIVTKAMVAAVDDKGLPVFMTPESIVDIRHHSRTKHLRRKRVATKGQD